jgi:excisionase family DNA binding protein
MIADRVDDRPKLPPILTTGQVAKLTHVAPRTVTKWCNGGMLKHYRVPGRNDRRITRESLLDFSREHGIPLEEPDEIQPVVNISCVTLADYLNALDERERRRVEDHACKLLGVTPEAIGARPRTEQPLDREITTYRRVISTLIEVAYGKHVLIEGDKVVGAFLTHEEAMHEGYHRFGLSHFLVKQVLDPEPVFHI